MQRPTRRSPPSPNRGGGGDWRRISYAHALHSARCIAQGLIDLSLLAERPVAILSDNDLEHLLLSLGAMLAGIPFAPISAAYSTLPQDRGKLKHILGVLTPGRVFASSASVYGRAIAAAVPTDTPVVLTNGRPDGRPDGRPSLGFDDLLATPPTSQVDAAHAKVGPDTIAKFLFTSGSTQLPKGVINTLRMLCSNQQMILQCFPALRPGRRRATCWEWQRWSISSSSWPTGCTPAAPAVRPASDACSCWSIRPASTAARSPTRDRSTSAPCWHTVPRWSNTSMLTFTLTFTPPATPASCCRAADIFKVPTP